MSAISGTRRSMKELVDGTIRVQIDIDPAFRDDFFKLFGKIDMPVALAPLVADFEKHEGDITEPEKPKSGQHIAELYKHGFFYNPKVLAALGPDEQYLEWVKNQPCAFDLGLGACDCDGDVVAAHVRRIASGSGTGIKPEYSAIPMCNKHHMEQHHYGESHFGGKEVFDTKAGEYKAKWAHMKLRKVFNVEHLRDVSLEDIRAWATEANVYHALPSMFIVQGEKGPYG